MSHWWLMSSTPNEVADRPTARQRATEAARRASATWTRKGAEIFNAAMQDNVDQMAEVVAAEDAARGPLKVLDLGCWDGATTATYVPERSSVVGVEVSEEAAARAAERGYKVLSCDLNAALPLPDEEFDVVTSNQVIEHLSNTDSFLGEAFRVLRPGGLVCVSTENLASWHNIASLVFGWQAFSLTNVSKNRSGLGNPLANLRAADEPFEDGWQHQRIFSYRGLLELAEAIGFEDVRILGAGYYPLPTRVAHRDPRHAAFITVVGRKPSA